jgi:hypothetical protein
MIMPDWTLVASSHFFLIPSLSAIAVRGYIPGGLVFGTYVVSSIYHATKPRFSWILPVDIAFAHIAHLVMVWTTAQWMPYSLPVYAAFMTCATTVYYYGHRYTCLAWDPDPVVSTRWHAFMHAFLGLSSAFSVMMAAKSGRNVLRFFHHANSNS